MRITRGLELRSYRHGLVGKADIVEFHQPTSTKPAEALIVEYKRGRPKAGRDDEFRVQLCGQALCLEEMLDVHIELGTIFFGQSRRRTEVRFDDNLRGRTQETIAALRKLIRSGRTPPARFEAKCKRCSLLHLCLPKAMRARATAARYLSAIISEADPKPSSQPER